MSTFKVLIHVNDKQQTYVAKIHADLKQYQAVEIAAALNTAFASRGVNWYVETQEEEDE